jgi:long-chain acyl-CoA synthetase
MDACCCCFRLPLLYDCLTVNYNSFPLEKDTSKNFALPFTHFGEEISMLHLKKLTIREVVVEGVHQYGNLPCVSYVNAEPVSYARLGLEVARVQSLLYQLGVRKGDRVALLGPNMPNWVSAYLAVTAMGAVIVPVMPEFTPAEIGQIIRHSASKVLIAAEKHHLRLGEEPMPDLHHKLILEDFTSFSPSGPQTRSLIDEPIASLTTSAEFLPAEVEEDDLAAIIYTSGTTGNSKGVMLTHRNIVSDALLGYGVQEATPDDVFLSILPLAHTYENTLGLMLPLIGGARIYYLDKPPTASALLPALAEIRPTLMLSVPLVIEKIFKNSVLPKLTGSLILRTLYKLSFSRRLLHRMAGRKLMKTFGGRLKFFGIGGAKLDGTVEQFLREAHFPYAIGYGLTETSPLIAGGVGKNISFQSTGPFLPGIEWKLDNPDETGHGEIVVRGDIVMKGYYNRPDLTSEVLGPDGWFRTGDLGFVDKIGNLHISGRLKNMIIGANGKNILPEEIESVINTYQHVVESIVVKKKGKLVALVYLNRDEMEARWIEMLAEAKHAKQEAIKNAEQMIDELLRDLQSYVNSKVNKFSQLQGVIYQPQPFEKTATQKIKRYLYT